MMLSHQSRLVTALARAPTIASTAPRQDESGAAKEELFHTGTSPWGSLHANDTVLSVQVLSVDGARPRQLERVGGQRGAGRRRHGVQGREHLQAVYGVGAACW
ncbi:hypothetical protein MY4824_001750 [Beauveria thailandica]